MEHAVRHGRRAAGGFTLVEMLAAIAVAAILGVLAIASYTAISRRASREGAAEDVMGLLRQARMSAVDSGRGALVRINPVERSLYGLSSTVVAAWHFESASGGSTPGAKSMDGAVYDDSSNPSTVPVMPGAAGLALEFDGSHYVDCRNYPIYDQTEGIRLEAYVYPEGTGPGVLGVIAKYDGALGYSLGLERTAGVPAMYRVHAGASLDVLTTPPGGLHLASYDAAAVLGVELEGSRWHQIAFEFDGFEGRLFVDGVLVDVDSWEDDLDDMDPNDATDKTFAAPCYVPAARSVPLEIGRFYYDPPGPPPAGYYYFRGRIDEPKLLSIAGGKHVTLPDGVAVVTSEPVVHFDAQGQLDVAYHSSPVYVGLGDPYQVAELAAAITDTDNTLTLRPKNPFPDTGGTVRIGSELIRYSSASGMSVAGLSRGAYGTAAASHDEGERVCFARVVSVTQTGTVQRAR